MGLFSRSRRKDDPQPFADPAAGTAVSDPADVPDPAEAPGPTDASDSARPKPDRELAGGPFDAADAPEQDRIDLGGLQVPVIDGMELRLDLDQRTRAVTGANLVLDGSSLQLQAFAAPKSRGLWEEVRAALRESVSGQGGTAESREGVFGAELVCRLPLKRADGRTGYRPARFLGIDGPRWFLRAILSGPAVGDAQASRRFEQILSQVVVVRGSHAMAPQELIALHLPGQRPGVVAAEEAGLDPLARGPEITQVGG